MAEGEEEEERYSLRGRLTGKRNEWSLAIHVEGN